MAASSNGSISSRWIIGGVLIAIGILFLLMNIGLIDRFHFWEFWPVVFIVVGITKMLHPGNRALGFWFFALGVWMQISTLRLWGFGWNDSWPLIIIAVGIFWIWNALEKDSLRKTTNNSDVPGIQIR